MHKYIIEKKQQQKTINPALSRAHAHIITDILGKCYQAIGNGEKQNKEKQQQQQQQQQQLQNLNGLYY